MNLKTTYFTFLPTSSLRSDNFYIFLCTWWTLWKRGLVGRGHKEYTLTGLMLVTNQPQMVISKTWPHIVENIFFRFSNISSTRSHAQLILCTVIKQLWTFFGS